MGYILNIDTAVETSSICLSLNGENVGLLVNPSQKDGAAWIHQAIQSLFNEHKVTLQQLVAIAISNGPGSYTGLRVAMATAKGLCYILKIPLITINTLKMMAFGVLGEEADLYCPMIDARRKEVFTAVFDKKLKEIVPPTNLIVEETSFKLLLNDKQILFFGNGSNKSEKIIQHPNAFFISTVSTARHLAVLSHQSFKAGSFADLAYSEPYYGKEFYTVPVSSLP